MGFGCCRDSWLEDFWAHPHKRVFGFGGPLFRFVYKLGIGFVCVYTYSCMYFIKRQLDFQVGEVWERPW